MVAAPFELPQNLDPSTHGAGGAPTDPRAPGVGLDRLERRVPRRPREASKRSTRAAEDASGAKERRKSPRFFYSAMGQPLPRTFDDWAVTT